MLHPAHANLNLVAFLVEAPVLGPSPMGLNRAQPEERIGVRVGVRLSLAAVRPDSRTHVSSESTFGKLGHDLQVAA
ncbi:hypothetical protein ACFL5O_05880 [Myxococcota bacterium]